MNYDKQQLLISFMLSSQEVYVKVSPILQPDYFDDRLKPTISFIKKYFDQYKAPPTMEQVKVETGQKVEVRSTMSKQEMSYAETEIEGFCKQRAIERAVIKSAQLVNEGKIGDVEKLIRDALTVSLQRNIGLDYFSDPETRLKLLAMSNNCVPTGIFKLDEYLGGGLNRKEMIIFSAPPGVGKSLTMGNIGKNLLKQNLHGVYITLELSEEVTAKRFDSMFSGISQTEILKNITETSIKIKGQADKHGKLFIKRMPESSTNANHIRAYLKEFEIIHGFTPDFIIVDYLDLMASVESVSAENTFTRDKFISEELRAIANEYNLIMITASQLNRGAQLLENIEDLGQAHIAGGISKVNTTDNLVAIIQNAQMKSRGEMMFKLLKTRSSSGVGNFFMMRFNTNTLCLENIDEESESNTAKLNKSISSYVRGKVAQGASVEVIQRPSEPKDKPGGLSIDNIPFQV